MIDVFFYPWSEWNTHKHYLQAAKQVVCPETLLKPRTATFMCGRVICIRRPDFPADYALVRSNSPEAWQKALEWAISDKPSPHAVTMAGWLTEIFHDPVKEILPDRQQHQEAVQIMKTIPTNHGTTTLW